MIYFIQADDPLNHIKIGFTDANPRQRLSDLQTGNSIELFLLGVIPGNKDVERSLHERFSGARVLRSSGAESGEWFRPVPSLLLFILEKSRPVVVVEALPQLKVKEGERDPSQYDFSPYLLQKVNPEDQLDPFTFAMAEQAYRRGAAQVAALASGLSPKDRLFLRLADVSHKMRRSKEVIPCFMDELEIRVK